MIMVNYFGIFSTEQIRLALIYNLEDEGFASAVVTERQHISMNLDFQG
jgi:hypothetical protein